MITAKTMIATTAIKSVKEPQDPRTLPIRHETGEAKPVHHIGEHLIE